jgi:hypothetical protein
MHAIAEAECGQDNNERKDPDYGVTPQAAQVELAVTNSPSQEFAVD